MTTPLLPAGRAPVRQDIYRLTMTNPLAHSCFVLWERGELTWEECLMAMALALADQNHGLIEHMVRESFRRSPPVILPGAAP